MALFIEWRYSGSGIEGSRRLGILLGRIDVVERALVLEVEQASRVTNEKFSRAVAAGRLIGRKRGGGGRLPNGAQGFRQPIVGAAERSGQGGRVAFTQELREHGVRQKGQVA